MPLSWNEIKTRAAEFAKEWEHEVSEDAEAKSFWDGFFHVFGVTRKRVGTFEQVVLKADGKQGFIDLLWKGHILVEHKSRGKDLDRAFTQAKDYLPNLKDSELPRIILVSDFERFRVHNLETGERTDFLLKDLVNHVQLFDFIAGYERRTYKEQDPVNIKAALLMGRLHDELKATGYVGHSLELYLVRLLFCLFADDTNIFERGILNDFLLQRTSDDGSDLAIRLAQLFEVLNTPPDRRLKTLDEQLAAFPYVNGKLFAEHLPFAAFTGKMRQILLDCSELDWGNISPAIFGSLFQSVMDEKERRNLGAHYTSEKNILKLIKPLFLDALYEEFETVKHNRKRLDDFHNKLANLRFLDPACGCGNFLIIAYRELRLLELEVLTALWGDNILTYNLEDHLKVNVDHFYGIEYDEFPAQIAQVAMWLIDHQMNMVASQRLGKFYLRLPLVKSANIEHANALQTDWQSLLNEGEQYDYIMGNPPFIGSKMMNDAQRNDLLQALNNVKGAGTLDYVAAWYSLGAAYVTENPRTRVAFVSTNSVTQGEQVGILWPRILVTQGLQIHFAHQTFQWSNEAKGNAAVHCIIVGYGMPIPGPKLLFHYENPKSDAVEIKATNINAYLVDAKNVFLASRNEPICNVPHIGIGNKPIDDGNYLFTTEEMEAFLKIEPNAKPYFRKWLGSHEFINGYNRWCLWVGDCSPTELKAMPEVLKRVQAVKEYRQASVSKPTQAIASKPTRFHVENFPTSPYLIIPETSSERRRYIPIGYEVPSTLASNAVKILATPSLFIFGVITSCMHMSWVRTVGGRLKSDYRYSASIVYNNYPWPLNPTDKQKQAVEKAAQAVLDARAQYPTSSLADLYDPITMPPVLSKAHAALDKAVDLCYRPQPFPDETRRMEFLFELYEQYVGGLFVVEKKKRRK